MNHDLARALVAESDPWHGRGRPGTNVLVMTGDDDDGEGAVPDLDAFLSGLTSVIRDIDASTGTTEREFRTDSRQRCFHGPARTAYAAWHGSGSAPDGGTLTNVSFGAMHPHSEPAMAVRSLHLESQALETPAYRRMAVALLDLALGAIDGDLPDAPAEAADASLEACHELRARLASRRGPEIVRTFCSFPLLGSRPFVQGMVAGSPVGLGAPVSGLPETASLWIKRDRNLWVAELRPFTTSSLITEEPDAMRRLRRIRTAREMGIVVGDLHRRRRAA